MPGRKGQLIVVRLPDEIGVKGRNDNHIARTKGRHKIAVHRVFVNVNLDLAHRFG